MTHRTIRRALVVAAVALGAILPATAARASHTITPSAGPALGVWGTTFSISAQTTANDQLQLLYRRVGSSGWATLASLAANEDGLAQYAHRPGASTEYMWRSTVDGTQSAVRRVDVQVGVHVNPSRSGSSALFSGRVLPAHPGTKVHLQVFENGAWRFFKAATLNSTSTYSITFRGTGRKSYRVVWPSQDVEHKWGLSLEVNVTFT